MITIKCNGMQLAPASLLQELIETSKLSSNDDEVDDSTRIPGLPVKRYWYHRL